MFTETLFIADVGRNKHLSSSIEFKQGIARVEKVDMMQKHRSGGKSNERLTREGRCSDIRRAKPRLTGHSMDLIDDASQTHHHHPAFFVQSAVSTDESIDHLMTTTSTCFEVSHTWTITTDERTLARRTAVFSPDKQFDIESIIDIVPMSAYKYVGEIETLGCFIIHEVLRDAEAIVTSIVTILTFVRLESEAGQFIFCSIDAVDSTITNLIPVQTERHSTVLAM